MGLILLADDSPHAQRMGQRILTDEGFQVVCMGDGKAAALCLPKLNPDVVIAGAKLPGLSGLELGRYAKSICRNVRVILTAGLVEELDETAARRAGCDAILRRPFEASVVMEIVNPLMAGARNERKAAAAAAGVAGPPTVYPTARVNGLNANTPANEIRAAVQRAIERELPRVLDELTQKVMRDLGR